MKTPVAEEEVQDAEGHRGEGGCAVRRYGAATEDGPEADRRARKSSASTPSEGCDCGSTRCGESCGEVGREAGSARDNSQAARASSARRRRRKAAIRKRRKSGGHRPATVRTWRAGRQPRHRILHGATEEAATLEVGLDPYQLQEQMRVAGCTELERAAVGLWLVRRSIRQVARELGAPQSVVRYALRSACEKLARWRRRNPEGMNRDQILAVYAAEVNRFGYAGEHHCPPGEEDCRKTGVCTRRWYLFYDPAL